MCTMTGSADDTLAARPGCVRGAALADAGAARVSSGEPVIVHVRDVRSGEMDVFAGTEQVRLHDPGLAAKLTQAVR